MPHIGCAQLYDSNQSANPVQTYKDRAGWYIRSLVSTTHPNLLIRAEKAVGGNMDEDKLLLAWRSSESNPGIERSEKHM